MNPMLLDPGMDLTLRPMRYPHFFDRYRDAIKNTWTVEEVDLHSDLADLASMSAAERHLVSRLVAFFATGDTIVANNLVLNLYQHVNSPEGRLYLSRQLFEEAVHVQFYLNLLDTYVPDEQERFEAFAAIENIPSIRRKADFCFRWIDSIYALQRAGDPRGPAGVPAQPDLLRRVHRGPVLLRRLRVRVLPALARPAQRAGVGHELGVPRRVDAHGVRVRRRRHRSRRGTRPVRRRTGRAGPRHARRGRRVRGAVRRGPARPGRARDVADRHARIPPARRRPAARAARHRRRCTARRNPFAFMELQDVQELSNFFERRVSAYQVGVTGTVSFDDDF